MADRRIHMEVLWVEGSTQSLLYITNAYWQDLKTSVLLDAVVVNFNWMCWASKERRNEKLNGQLEKGRLPLLMSCTSLCLIPNTRCNFARIKTKKTQLHKNYISKPGRFLQASDLTSIYNYRDCVRQPSLNAFKKVLAFYDLLSVSNKQMSLMPMESSAFLNDLLESVMGRLIKI